MNSTRFQPWHELTILAVIWMEMSWVTLWFRLISQTGALVSFWQALAVLGGMLTGVYLFAHLLNLLRLRHNLRRGVLAVVLLGSVLLGEKWLLFAGQPVGALEIFRRTILVFNRPDGSIPSEFFTALTIILIWWRGISLAGREVDSTLVRRSFYTGAVLLFIYGLIAPATGETGFGPLILFLIAWLLAMSAARIYRLARFGRGQAATFDRKWMAGIFLAVLGVVGLAALAASLVEWKVADLVTLLLVWSVRAALVVGALLMSPFVLLLSALLPYLQKWLAGLPQGLQNITEAMQQLGNLVEQLQQATPEETFSLPVFVRPAILWGILGLAVLYAVWALQKRSQKSIPGIKEESETLLSRGEILQKLLAAIRSGAEGLAGQLGGALGLGGARRRLAAARVRRIYAQLMDLSAILGKPRPPALTPLEYLPLLDKVFPNQPADLRLITGAYLKVRYGELPESRQELDGVEAAWKRVREQGQVILEYKRMKKAPG